MIENDKVIVLQGHREMADFILNKTTGRDWNPEFTDSFLKGHVVGYLDGKVVVLDSCYEGMQERIRQREEEFKKAKGDQ